MRIETSDTYITLKDENEAEPLSVFNKPTRADYSNVTIRQQIDPYYIKEESIWEHFRSCMETLGILCGEDAYLGCYYLAFCRLYPILLSSSQAKTVIACGAPLDCSAYRIYQNFMTFLQHDSALIPLPPGSFSLTSVADGSCFSLLCCLDVCSSPDVICDAICKVKQGGVALFYGINSTLPDTLLPYCASADKDVFPSCAVYALPMGEALRNFAQTNSTEALILSKSDILLHCVEELHKLLAAMSDGRACPQDLCRTAVILLQQAEELLLFLYDYLENDALPVHANVLKEAVITFHAESGSEHDAAFYRTRLIRAWETFYNAIETEFL